MGDGPGDRGRLALGRLLFAPLGQAFIDSYGAVQALVMLSFVALVPLLAIAPTGRGASPRT